MREGFVWLLLGWITFSVALRYPLMKPSPAFEKFLTETKSEHVKYPQKIDPSLPQNFDGRVAWPGCIHPVLDQGQCESCWAFAATETLSDRFCIYTNGSVNVVLSPQNILSCEEENLGCSMGSPPNFAWRYLTNWGVVTMECSPYTSGQGDSSSCPSPYNQCPYTSNKGVLYKSKSYSHVGNFIYPSYHIQDIMKALLDGPVDATFNVYGDFQDFPFEDGGIYQHQGGEYEGLHSVKVIGYGVQNGTDYWLVQNSWGPYWGDHGFFRIIRGIDDCSFESMMYTGIPDLSSL